MENKKLLNSILNVLSYIALSIILSIIIILGCEGYVDIKWGTANFLDYFFVTISMLLCLTFIILLIWEKYDS